MTNVEIPNVFKVAEVGKRPYEFADNVHVSVAIELHSDLTVINRQVYSVLDWLGDIGGLSEALFFIGTFILTLSTLGSLEIMLVSMLYRTKESPDQSTNGKPSPDLSKTKSHRASIESDHSQRIEKISSLRLLCLQMARMFPFLSHCCGPSRSERILTHGLKKLKREIDIVDFIKRFRRCEALIKSLDPKREHLTDGLEYIGSDSCS